MVPRLMGQRKDTELTLFHTRRDSFSSINERLKKLLKIIGNILACLVSPEQAQIIPKISQAHLIDYDLQLSIDD